MSHFPKVLPPILYGIHSVYTEILYCIYDGSCKWNYPISASVALIKLGFVESILCGLSFIKAKMFPVKKPKSFHDWVANNFGERLYLNFFKTYTEKVWGMSCDEISADWAAQRIKGLDLIKLV